MHWFDGLLYPIMVVVAWIMVQFHKLFELIGMDPAGGTAWALSIVGLVIVMRIVLIPLFFRQIKASRGMQLIQPEMQKIQKKYKGKTDPASREAMSRETMELYRKHGTNPFSSCLPILAQSPIFFALFRVLNSLPALADGTYSRANLGPLTRDLAAQAESATVLGAPLSGTFMTASDFDSTQALHIRIVTIVLVVAMSVTTFTTQRQLTMKNMPPAALTGPMAQQQKMLMYIFPLIFAFSGVNFPIGVLIYWTTTNLWTMGQQFYTIRRMPAPGSQAELALKARRAKRAAAHGGVGIEEAEAPTIEERPRQRVQPVRKDRAKKRPSGPEGSGGGSRPTAKPSDSPAASTGKGSGTGSGSSSAANGSGAAGAAPRAGKAAGGSAGTAGSDVPGSTAGTPKKKRSTGQNGGSGAGSDSTGAGRPTIPDE